MQYSRKDLRELRLIRKHHHSMVRYAFEEDARRMVEAAMLRQEISIMHAALRADLESEWNTPGEYGAVTNSAVLSALPAKRRV